ncbi:IS1634 family transposase [uncultured Paludibaculum sp.]|uniref:IS1634 family transposase n=1 Tax=uncultured Paludibaculum sp. TaxID=1765020 RepID=UPI002AAB8551|nr:IS1634 family transposase [uncultured Paludibaculum sp.]
MFLRSNTRIKDGKEHRYYTVVESRRLQSGKVAQRQVLYLGEINDSQQAAWRRTLEVFDEEQQRYTPLSLFPEDRPVPADAIDSVQVKLSEMKLERARPYGNCWLGCELWRQLQLDRFWSGKLPRGREGVAWPQVLELLVVNRLIDPGSEFRLHRQWFDQSAMDVLLGQDFAVAEKDRLYRCLDRVLEHKQDLFVHLQQRWKDLFDAEFDLLLYDLTSTYVEGEAEQNPKARYGYSRDKRPDCKQVVIALIVTPAGLPLAYEVMAGNTSEKTTLRGFLDRIESLYGKARRVWLMDRGIPTEALLREMRTTRQETFYLVGTSRAKIREYEKQWLELPWQKVRESVEVKLFAREGELYVLAKSEGRQAKEMAMRRKKLARLLRKLRAMRRSCPKRDQLLMRVGAAKTDAGRAFGFVKINLPRADQEVTKETFTFQLDKAKLKEAELRDGHYLLRTNLLAEDPAVLWDRYVQLTQIEAAFKCLKSDLGIRPIHHQLEHRVDAHILVAFLSYCLTVRLRHRLRMHVPGLTPRAVLEKLAGIQMLDVSFPTTDGRRLIMPRYTEPNPEQAILLHHLNLVLPQQPPPRITTPAPAVPCPQLKM